MAKKRSFRTDRPQLGSQAYSALKKLLVSGALPAGRFLSERQLAAQLGMSKTPVHSALERLRAEGFLDISPQQGIVVRQLTIDEILDLYELREAIEPFVVKKLAGRLSPEQVRMLKETLDGQEETVGAADVEGAARLDSEFHLSLCKFLGNRKIEQVMAQLCERVCRKIARVFADDRSRMAASVREHRQIAGALTNGQGDRAAALVIEHLDRGRRSTLAPRRR